MRRIALLLAIILVVSAPITMSVTADALTIRPQLSFNGTTANCGVTVVGGLMSEHIEVEMKLMYGSTCVDSWYADGYGYVSMQEHTSVTKGSTYDLVVTVTINGVSHTPVSSTNTCK